MCIETHSFIDMWSMAASMQSWVFETEQMGHNASNIYSPALYKKMCRPVFYHMDPHSSQCGLDYIVGTSSLFLCPGLCGFLTWSYPSSLLSKNFTFIYYYLEFRKHFHKYEFTDSYKNFFEKVKQRLLGLFYGQKLMPILDYIRVSRILELDWPKSHVQYFTQ